MTSLEQVEDLNCNRQGIERRDFTWRTVVFGFVRSRRRDKRRDTEAEPVFVDWHHPWLFFVATGTMLLSSMDAFFTLRLLERGAIELNPFMAMFIEWGALPFAVSKMLLTGLGILALVFMSRLKFMNRLRTGLILTGFFAFYACLVCYEIVYLLRIL